MSDDPQIIRIYPSADAARQACDGQRGAGRASLIPHEQLKRERLIRGIVERLRACDLGTLEAVACVFDAERSA